jgi:pyrroline-5-carboxylate reductase
VQGATALAAQSSHDLQALRQEVTSPNGTTEAGLKPLLKADALHKLIDKAIAEAAKRSEELAG